MSNQIIEINLMLFIIKDLGISHGLSIKHPGIKPAFGRMRYASDSRFSRLLKKQT